MLPYTKMPMWSLCCQLTCSLCFHGNMNLALLLENRSSGFPTRSDTNRAVQSQKMARGLKLQI